MEKNNCKCVQGLCLLEKGLQKFEINVLIQVEKVVFLATSQTTKKIDETRKLFCKTNTIKRKETTTKPTENDMIITIKRTKTKNKTNPLSSRSLKLPYKPKLSTLSTLLLFSSLLTFFLGILKFSDPSINSDLTFLFFTLLFLDDEFWKELVR